MLPMSRTAAVDRIIVSAQVPADVHEELERLAREADRSLSAEIRRALVAHVGRDREQFGGAAADLTAEVWCGVAPHWRNEL
jgi:hypothetical protein